MNKDLYKELGIDETLGLKEKLSALENVQYECLERLNTVNDDERRNSLELQVSKIDKEISEIKDQIKSLKSGIILDDGNFEPDNAENNKPVKSAKQASAEKKEEVSKKVEALKQKEAEKKAKEEERKQKAAEKAAQAAQAGVGLTPSTSNSSTQVDANPELTNALIAYKQGDYSKAINEFSRLAENDNETAQYMLANMYRRGEGTSSSEERAEYWMKRSADNGYVTAQLDYGIMCLASGGNNGDDAKAEEGLTYVGKAADSGEKQAILKYIEVAKKQIGGRPAYEKAIAYCDTLKRQSTDSYDNEQYDASKTELNKLRKEALKIEKKIKNATVFTIIGSVVTILGALYLFIGIHPMLWKLNGFLRLIPNAFDFLVNSQLYSLLSGIMHKNGVLGLELIAIGWMFLEAGNNSMRKKYSAWIEKVSNVGCLAIAGWHFFAQVQEDLSIFKALGWYILAVVAAVVVGTVLGIVLGKIFRTK